MTEKQSIKFCDSGWWKDRTPCEITALQLYESRLCLPEFQIFHGAVEAALGRPVFTHEFVCVQHLQREFEERHPEAETLKAAMAREKDAFCSALEPDAVYPCDKEGGSELMM